MDYPLFPPFCSDFIFFTAAATDIDTRIFSRFFERRTRLRSQAIATMFNTTLSVWAPTAKAFATLNKEDHNRLLDLLWVRHAEEFILGHISAGAKTREEWAAIAPGAIPMLNGATYELQKSGDDPLIRTDSELTEEARASFGDLIALDG
jgi:hypothetical protein